MSLCAFLFNIELFRRTAMEKCASFKGITVAFSGGGIVKVINVKHAPELCLTDAFTSSASEQRCSLRRTLRQECSLEMDKAR